MSAEPTDAESTASGAAADESGNGDSSNVTVLRSTGADGSERTFHIIGTAHVSRASVKEVRAVIAEVKPDTVCVELDPMRFEALTDDTRWRKLDIFQVIRQKKVLFLMASLALQAYQKRLGEQLGVRPGAELLAGAEAAEAIGAEVVLADRDVQATLKRTWANLSFVNKLKLVAALMASVFEGEEIDEEQIEALKDREHLSDMMTEFARVMPQVKEPLIDERDRYLISSVEQAPGNTVVAVVGAGHVPGMVEHFGSEVDRDALERIPPPRLITRGLKWLVPTVILLAFSYGYYKHQGANWQEMVYAWLLPNAIVAGLFTLLAGGKLLSVVTGVVASPITSLNPTIGAGMFVGLVEAWLRKPTVQDAEQLGREVTTWRGMWNNAFSRILIVAIAASLGSSLGAYIGATWVVKLATS
jgi:pheromone shutdown-related protein TraB